MRKGLLFTLLLTGFFAPLSTRAQTTDNKPLLLRQPTLSAKEIAFVYGGDLWIAPRAGGDAQRLTTGVGTETGPIFSPDGKTIAFTGEYDGNTDVYTVPAAGGVPRRLTYHPDYDAASGWTPDGARALFFSNRDSISWFPRLFTMGREGAWATPLPLPMGMDGAYSPDGTRLAYLPLAPAFDAWKRYRGGRATPIWIARLSDSQIEKIPRTDSNDIAPMWVGDTVYFLSDRSGPMTLFACDTGSKKVTSLLPNEGLDIKSASAGPGAIVYEQFGAIHLFDLFDVKTGKAHAVDIRVSGDLPEVRPRFEKVASRIANFTLSPGGVRAVFEARGEIFTVPAEKGDARNLTNTPGVAERDPAWSPDGKWIAYFSDESGEYALHLRDQTGRGAVRKIGLGSPPSFFYHPTWSPDSKKIAFADRRLNLWVLDLDKSAPVRVDTNTFDNWNMTPVWSPDSRWIAYDKMLKNRMSAVFVYELASGKSRQITDGMSDVSYPAWDKSGKYLFFTASTDAGPSLGFIDMSGMNRPVTRSAYVVVLRRDLPSPLAPESDEEKLKEDEKKEDEKKDAPAATPKPAAAKTPDVGIDFDDIGQRVLSLPIPARNYTDLRAGKAGVLFLAESAPVGAVGVRGRILHRFDLSTRKTEKFLEGAGGVEISDNGAKLLYGAAGPGARYAIVATDKAPAPGSGMLNLDGMEARVDPRAEWKQMYHEVWRIERDFFYDPNYHGLDLAAAERRYAPYLENLSSRADLNYLFREMLGELTVGHLFVGGGDTPEAPQVKGGLLGADYVVANGRYRFTQIYNGENWNPQLRAPLTQPGVNVRENEYLLQVNGQEVRATDNLYRFFEGTAGRQVVLRVGPNPTEAGSREVTVVPVEDETGLRNLHWIEENRRKVDRMSGGRLAYIYLPDTGEGGYTAFNRYFFAQSDRDGAVVDERFNRGGMAADYIIDYLRRPLLNFWSSRYGETVTTPGLAIFGPKTMIINEYAGSGGDLMPWYFRKTGIGPLVGKRTWGGLVGIGGYPSLMDGGTVTAPHFAFWNPNGTWEVENRGVAPDIEVEMDPAVWRAGHDPQLEKAVEVTMDALRKNPPPTYKKPAYPNYHPGGRSAAAGSASPPAARP